MHFFERGMFIMRWVSANWTAEKTHLVGDDASQVHRN